MKPIELRNWRDAAPPRQLRLWHRAPDLPGFYELGFVQSGIFFPKYGGSARRLQGRLKQHWTASHNPHIKKASRRISFRFLLAETEAQARYVEAHYIAAFRSLEKPDPDRDRYGWNSRQEWARLWPPQD